MGLVPWHIDVVPSQLLFDSSILHTQDILCHIVFVQFSCREINKT